MAIIVTIFNIVKVNDHIIEHYCKQFSVGFCAMGANNGMMRVLQQHCLDANTLADDYHCHHMAACQFHDADEVAAERSQG